MGSALASTFISRKNPNDRASLHFLEAMLAGGMSPNKSTKYGTTLLQRAAGGSDTIEQVKLLVDDGADVNAHDNIGRTALVDSISAENPAIGIYLVEHGAAVDTSTTTGVTPAWQVQGALDHLHSDPMHTEFEKLGDLMIGKGVNWPPDSPEVVREQMRAKGLNPVVPAGHTPEAWAVETRRPGQSRFQSRFLIVRVVQPASAAASIPPVTGRNTTVSQTRR
ncbi:MAG: ankyrin repeat domain-containing protein [Rhodanobacteraceae bacterium]